MKKRSITISKILLTIIIITISILLVFSYKSIATSNPIEDPDWWKPSETQTPDSFTNKAGTILGILNVVGVIVSVGGLVVIGIGTMVSSVSEQSKYKKALGQWLVGALIICSVTTIPNIAYKIVEGTGLTQEGASYDRDKNANILITQTPTTYTKGDVNVNIQVVDRNFAYMLLPDGTKIQSSSYSYKISKNGTYVFSSYDKFGYKTQKKIVIKNIDTTPPYGTCTAEYSNGKVKVQIDAEDAISGIDRYEINGIEYTTNNIELNGYQSSINVAIYDKAGNMAQVEATYKDNSIISSPNITFAIKDSTKDPELPNSAMQYALYEPSIHNNSTGLIVWLHGSGETGGGLSAVKGVGFPATLENQIWKQEWGFEGFNAYVLTPNLPAGSATWESKEKQLYSLIDQVANSKNVNKNKICIVGHSLGGEGVMHMATKYPDYFSAAVVLSGYSAGDPRKIKESKLPIRGYTSDQDSSGSKNYMSSEFEPVLGKAINLSDVWNAKIGHGSIPKYAFKKKSDKYNQSELIVWMLSQDKTKR